MPSLQRVRQFFRAVTAVLTEEEKHFAQTHLSLKERHLFHALPIHEQKHAIQTALTVQTLIRHPSPLPVKESILITAALLHDIGKLTARFNPFEKALFVLLPSLFPSLYKHFAQLGLRPEALPLFKRFYLHKEHGAIGASLLKEIGSDATLIQLIKNYDQPVTENTSLELKILKEADDLN